jgi:uncharacterized protein YndB with AHSA1/START domain
MTTTTKPTSTISTASTASSTPRTVSLAVKASPDEVWDALTDGDVSPAYYYGFSIRSTFAEGADYSYVAGESALITGTITDIDPGHAISMTFNGVWEPGVASLPESHVSYSIDAPSMPIPGVSVLTMTHSGMPDGDIADNVERGWVLILSGLKTLVETGAPLMTPPAG